MHAARALVLVLPLLFGACHDAESEKRLTDALKAATDKASKAEHDAQEKVAAAEKQIEQMKAEMAATTAKLKAEADDLVSKAQASAEEQAKAAEAALKKARQGFKEEGRLQLANANKEVAELSAKAAKAPAKVKAEVNKSMQKIVTQQKAIAKDIAAFDTATIEQFKTVKAKLNQDLAVMKATIRAARAKIL